MNRDTREIARVYELLDQAAHARVLREPLNAAAMLCEEFCIAAAGFVVEDGVAFELFESQSCYLKAGLIRLPIRERNLADFAEKKKGEYAPARNRYSGLFDDTRMNYLSSLGAAIVPRKVQIAPAIVAGFQAGVDTNEKAWSDIRCKAPPSVIESLRSTPNQLSNDGKALTWSIMYPHFANEAQEFGTQIRDALQHVYFKEYCREFRLIVLSDIPYIHDVFYLPVDRRVYSIKRLRAFLRAIGIEFFLNASADFIVRMRNTSGFTELMDAYAGLAEVLPKDSDLTYYSNKAVRSAKFDWAGFGPRRIGMVFDPTEFEALEIADACAELATILSQEHDLKKRVLGDKGQGSGIGAAITRRRSMKITVFVALEEELNILVRHLELKRNAEPPEAQGKLGEIDIDVLCPREMGRVPAAIAVTKYLSRSSTIPDLIMCVGLAGGFGEAVIDPGTVICANTVVDLANRKVTDNQEGKAQSKFRRKDFACDQAVYSVAMADDFNRSEWETHCRNQFDWPNGRTPSLREGKIASVDEVISSNDHRDMLIESEVKLLGVEMEAGGVCAAAKSFELPVAVLRVVSDMADPSKADDKWRTLGMKTLAELIKRLPFKRVIETARR